MLSEVTYGNPQENFAVPVDMQVVPSIVIGSRWPDAVEAVRERHTRVRVLRAELDAWHFTLMMVRIIHDHTTRRRHHH